MKSASISCTSCWRSWDLWGPQNDPKGRKVTWKTGLKILAVSAFVYAYATQPRLTVFMVEEALTVLLGIAALLVLVLLTAIVFLLLWQAASLVCLCLKWVWKQIAGTRERSLGTRQAMSHPFPGH